MRLFVLSASIIVLVYLNSFAKEQDSIKVYKLGAIVVDSEKEKTISTTNISTIPINIINNSDVNSFAELSSKFSAGFIQTNSRGESLLFLRGASERQTALFFDGALLNIPWDNRIDLSQIPTDVIGSVSVTKGASSILYGANTLGGAVEVSSFERTQEGFGGKAKVQLSDGNKQHYSLNFNGRKKNFNFITTFSMSESNGILLPDFEDALLNQNSNSKLRTNTQQQTLSSYSRLEYNFENTSIGLSFNRIDSEKGVPPLTNLQPENARFWQYPEWNRNMIIFNALHSFSKDLNLRATLWFDGFNQTINQYTDISYSALDAVQEDEDITLGTRLSLNYKPSRNEWLTFAFNAFNSEHEEIINTASTSDINIFEQTTISTGAEYKIKYNNYILSAGATFDFNKTPKTGDFNNIAGNEIADYGAFVGGKYLINNNLSIFTNISRKTRFPTLREQFSSALNKFIVNPNLGAETGIISELGVDYTTQGFNVNIALFASFYDDLIVKDAVIGDSLKRTQRINLNSANILGMDASFYYKIMKDLVVSGHLSIMDSDGETSGFEDTELEYRPQVISFINLDYDFRNGLKVQGEFDFIGKQYGEDESLNIGEGGIRQISSTALLNFRLSYDIIIDSNFPTKIFLRTNNVLNQYRLSKIGLPAAGRTLSIGFSSFF